MPTDRLTEADINNDLKSTKRKLHKPLRLVTKLQRGKQNTGISIIFMGGLFFNRKVFKIYITIKHPWP